MNTKLFFAFIAIVVFVFFVLYFTAPVLYFKALFAKVPVTIPDIMGMRLRKVPPDKIIYNLIRCKKAGIRISKIDLEAHFLAGGNVDKVVSTIISAKTGGLDLDYRTATSADLAGIDLSGVLTKMQID